MLLSSAVCLRVSINLQWIAAVGVDSMGKRRHYARPCPNGQIKSD